jgi:hypothetical protein
MAERVYHVRSTGQLIVLQEDIVKNVKAGLEAKIDALQDDVDTLNVWLQRGREGEECPGDSTSGTGA